MADRERKQTNRRSLSNSDAGYSGRPLAAKLGLKAGQRVWLLGVPPSLTSNFEDIDFAACRSSASVATALSDDEIEPVDYVHIFVLDAACLEKALPVLRRKLVPEGMIWVSWPKRASKIATDLSDDVVRTRALACGLVDVKVCAVDTIWSGLKLVIPRRSR